MPIGRKGRARSPLRARRSSQNERIPGNAARRGLPALPALWNMRAKTSPSPPHEDRAGERRMSFRARKVSERLGGLLLQQRGDRRANLLVRLPIQQDETARAHEQFLKFFEPFIKHRFQREGGDIAVIPAKTVRANAWEKSRQNCESVPPE